MTSSPRLLPVALALALAACGDGKSDASSGGSTTADLTSTGATATAPTTGTTGSSSGEPVTTSGSSSTGEPATTGDTSTGGSTTGGTSTGTVITTTGTPDTTTGDTSTGDSTSTGSTGGSSTGEPVVCPPAEPNVPPCKACAETQCCSEYDVCQADAKCDCIFDCIFGGNGPMGCAFQCMQVGMNGKPLDDMFLCMINADCNQCPF